MAEDKWLTAERERVYRSISSRVVTAFHVPSMPADDKLVDYSEEWDNLLSRMPFQCIRIVYPTGMPDHRGVTVQIDVVVESMPDISSEDDVLASSSFRLHVSGPGPNGQVRSFDTFEFLNDTRKTVWTRQMARLLELLRDSRNRYIDKPLSRQVKRAMGIKVPNYHEYIIVDRRDIKPDDDAKRWSEIARRHPYLHAVRSHMRMLECGRLIQVRAHTRGKGILFQVKDYKVMAGVN